jgi:hypothetical protein
MNFERIASRVFKGGVLDYLRSVLPREVYAEVSSMSPDFQREFMSLLETNGSKTFKIVKKEGGDRARMGFDEGVLLSINSRIKPYRKDDPSGSEMVKWPKVFKVGGNRVEMALFRNDWMPLD